jgi:predicted ATPase
MKLLVKEIEIDGEKKKNQIGRRIIYESSKTTKTINDESDPGLIEAVMVGISRTPRRRKCRAKTEG